MCAEGVRRQAIKEVLSLDVSPRVAQRIWLRVSGVCFATSQLTSPSRCPASLGPNISMDMPIIRQCASQHAFCTIYTPMIAAWSGLDGLELPEARLTPLLQRAEAGAKAMLMCRCPCGRFL